MISAVIDKIDFEFNDKEGEQMLNVSVIIPMFNAEKSIERCLTSLLCQTFDGNYEILVIDDGSSDQCGQIVNNIALEESRIKYYFQENHGISYSRNFGILQAKGEFICFVDSDDYVHSDYLSNLYDKATVNNADITICDFYECNGKTCERNKLIDFDMCSVNEQPNLIFDINSSPWNKLFKKSFIIDNQISFPNNKKYEDAAFMLVALLKARRIVKVNTALVYYQIHEGSETTSMDERVFDIFDILLQIRDAYQGVGNSEVIEYLTFFAINRISVYQLQQIFQKDKSTALSFVQEGFSFLNKYYPHWQFNIPFCKANNWAKRKLKTTPFLMKMYISIFWKGSMSHETN